MNANAVAKIAMLKGSVRCLAFGLLGLLPFGGLPFTLLAFSMEFPPFGLLGLFSLIGLPFALLSLVIGVRVSRQEKRHWNVARPYWICGTVCAAAGVVMWVVVAGLFGYNIVTSNWPYN